MIRDSISISVENLNVISTYVNSLIAACFYLRAVPSEPWSVELRPAFKAGKHDINSQDIKISGVTKGLARYEIAFDPRATDKLNDGTVFLIRKRDYIDGSITDIGRVTLNTDGSLRNMEVL